MDNKNNLLEKFVKKKKLQKLSNSLVAIIPKIWIRPLGWNQNTNLIMSLDPEAKKITIKEDDSQKVSYDGEEVSTVIAS